MMTTQLRLVLLIPTLAVACGGRAELDGAPSNGDESSDVDDLGSGSSAPLGSGGAVPGAGGAIPVNTGGSPGDGGSLTTGGGPSFCGPPIKTCTPDDCTPIGDDNKLTLALESACKSMGVPSVRAESGCGYVSVSWTGDVGDYGAAHYEMAGGRLIGSSASYKDECGTWQGARPDCPTMIEYSACDGPDPRSACTSARTASQDYFDSLLETGRACMLDSDCTMVSFGMECGSICPLSLNKFEIGTVGTLFYEFDDDGACDACTGPLPSSCPTPPLVSLCIEGRCQLDGDYAAAGLFAPFED